MDFFEKIYVLSLKRDVERRRSIEKKFNRLNIDFEFFDACDGYTMNKIWKELKNPFFENANYLACNISHLCIYNDALSRGFKRILILEDDVCPHEDAIKLFSTFHEFIKDKDYDILYLGWIPLTDDCLFWDYNIINDRFLTKEVFLSKNLWGLYAYSPSESLMIETINLYRDKFPMEIDRYFVSSIQPRNKSYAFTPQIFCHGVYLSNNTNYIDESSYNKSIDYRFSDVKKYIF